MLRTTSLCVVALLSVMLVGTVCIEQHRLAVERARTQGAALHASNVIAERDRARDIAATNRNVARIVRDSLRVAAVVPSRRDSTPTVRDATFNIQQTPYTISAVVDLADPPDSARMAIRVSIDPIHFDARVSCSSADEHGIRSASIRTSSPRWASVRFDHVGQSPEVCRAEAAAANKHRLIDFRRAMIGAGPVRTINGRWTVGLFVGAGLAA
ncbi:MAG: hypothetical protein ABI442_07555 [Gemmatimonadaceae bacterium]